MNVLAGGPHYPLFQVISPGDNGAHTRSKYKVKRQHPDSPFGMETDTVTFPVWTLGDPRMRTQTQTPTTAAEKAPPTTTTTQTQTPTTAAEQAPPTTTTTQSPTNTPPIISTTTSTTSSESKPSSITAVSTGNASKDTSTSVGTPTGVAQKFITSPSVLPNTRSGVGTTAVMSTTFTTSSSSMTTTKAGAITSSKKNMTPVIAGSIIGSIVVIMVMACALVYRRRYLRRRYEDVSPFLVASHAQRNPADKLQAERERIGGHLRDNNSRDSLVTGDDVLHGPSAPPSYMP